MSGLFAKPIDAATRFCAVYGYPIRHSASPTMHNPAIAASGLLELKEAAHRLPSGSYASLAVATVVSGIVGYASIWFLLRYLRTHSTALFIVYRVIVGGLILSALAMGYISGNI